MIDLPLEKLGETIKKRAKEKYKTNLDFACACDVDERTIRRIFKGEQNISLYVLFKICNVLEIRPSHLLKEIGK